MSDNLFEGLPPPSYKNQQQDEEEDQARVSKVAFTDVRESSPVPPPKPALKSALKRPKTVEDKLEQEDSAPEKASAPEKRLRFKTTTDASETQIIEAMQKIASHIKNKSKFSKASKLAIQLIQADSVKAGTSDQFFALLDAAMTSENSCTDPSVRSDYHALFSAAQDVAECLSKKQKNQLASWTLRAVVANDLFTDDSFVFSKAAGRIKETINNLPVATEDDDEEEAAALKDETGATDEERKTEQEVSSASCAEEKKDESDPFGLDALIPTAVKKDERAKGKKEMGAKTRKDDDDEESKKFLSSQREALIICLEIAAQRYKTPWCQTVIDILVKHAFDNVNRFTFQQRGAIEKLWNSVHEQQMRRKQGKSVNGKLDVTAFEWLQEKYAGEKISIRRAVGGSGERRAQQWLG